MGNAVDEIKSIPLWGWLIAGVIVVAVVIAYKRSKSAAPGTPTSSTPGALQSTDTTQANAMLYELQSIQQELAGVPGGANATSSSAGVESIDAWLAATGINPGTLTGAEKWGVGIFNSVGAGGASNVIGRAPWGQPINIDPTPLFDAQGNVWYKVLGSVGGFIPGSNLTNPPASGPVPVGGNHAGWTSPTHP